LRLQYGLDCEEALRPTATFRTIAPLTPVRPACSEPIALNKIKTGLLWIVSAADTKCEVQIEHSDQKISDHLRHADVALARNGSNRIPRSPAVPKSEPLRLLLNRGKPHVHTAVECPISVRLNPIRLRVNSSWRSDLPTPVLQRSYSRLTTEHGLLVYKSLSTA